MTRDPDLIGTTEAAQLRKVDVRTIQRWANNGVLHPVHKIPGKRGAYLFLRADVEALAPAQEQVA